MVSLEAIKAVRAEVSASIADCKAALAKTSGDVHAAIELLKTPEDRIRDRAPTAPPQKSGQEERVPTACTPSDESAQSYVLADFERELAAVRAKRPAVWVGDPDAKGLVELASGYETAFGRPMPDALHRFLTKWNGYDDGASTCILWACAGRDRWVAADYDQVHFDSFAFGEIAGSGYLLLRMDRPEDPEVWFFDYDVGECFRVSRNFRSFLRDWINTDSDLFWLVQHAHERSERSG